MKRILNIVILMLMAATAVMSQSYTLKGIVKQVVHVGENFKLRYELNTMKVQNFTLGSIPDGLDVLEGPKQSSSSSSWTINGKVGTSESLNMHYVLTATKPGKYTIPAASAIVGGQTVKSEPLTVQVLSQDEISIDGSGTGFLIDKRGYLATNNHVTEGARAIYVCLQKDGVWKSYHAVLVKSDPINDLSIIRIEDAAFKPFPSLPYNFTSNVADVASEIFTLGYPQVHVMGTDIKYTVGTINSKTGIMGDPTHYQISAHIDHGNSGGPMFNSKGAIIGITDSGLDKAEFGDVNYAIKSSYLKSLVDALSVKLELPHDTSIERLSRVGQIKVLSKYTALILVDFP